MRFAFVALALLACLGHSVSFTHKQDTAAVDAVTRTWSGGSTTLSLCEDVATAAMTPESGCQVNHIARGGDQGVQREDAPSGGCGGCPEGNDVFVTGKLNGKNVKGQVALGSLYDKDPYAFPYFVDLTCTDPMNPCSFGAQLDADGTLTVTTNTTGSGMTMLTVGGAATCQ